MYKTEELEFWLKKRGVYPFVSYRGSGMKAMVNLHIPLDEIADRFGVTELLLNGKTYQKKNARG